MKKIIALALVLALTLSLAACGAKEAVQDAVKGALPGSSTLPASSSAPAQTQPSSTSEAKPSGGAADTSTVEGRLAKAGLKLEDIQPDTFAEASLYNCDKDEVVLYITDKGGPLGEAVMKPLVMRVIEATAAVADDEKYWDAYYGLGEPKELDFSKSNWDAWMFVAQWSYQKDGEWVTVTLGVVPAEEPDEQDNYDYEVTLAFLY